MGGIVIAIWEKSNFFGSIGSLKCTKNAIFLQGGQNLPPPASCRVKIALVKGATKKGANKEQNSDYKTQNVAKRSKMRLFGVWFVMKIIHSPILDHKEQNCFGPLNRAYPSLTLLLPIVK